MHSALLPSLILLAFTSYLRYFINSVCNLDCFSARVRAAPRLDRALLLVIGMLDSNVRECSSAMFGSFVAARHSGCFLDTIPLHIWSEACSEHSQLVARWCSFSFCRTYHHSWCVLMVKSINVMMCPMFGPAVAPWSLDPYDKDDIK